MSNDSEKKGQVHVPPIIKGVVLGGIIFGVLLAEIKDSIVYTKKKAGKIKSKFKKAIKGFRVN